MNININSEQINGQLHTKWAARNIVYKEITDSTNIDADELGRQGAEHGTLVVADRQDAGKGSHGRVWISPAGMNVFMSLIVRPDINPSRVPMLTLVMGMAIAKGVEDACNKSGCDIHSGIKWPNDIVIDSRKICGILTELRLKPDNSIDYCIIGVGINVNQDTFADEIKDMAGSLFTQTGHQIDRNLVISCCMESFEDYYERFIKTQDLSLLIEEYEDRLLNRGNQVRILDPKGEYEAKALGISNLGELRIMTADQREEKINAGEVSVRGLYGYT